MTYFKCLIDSNKIYRWIHHEISRDIRLIYHKRNNRIEYITLCVPDELKQWYIERLKRAYGVSSLHFLVTVR